MNDNATKAQPSQFFTALTEEYKIRLDTLENSRARTLGMMPVLLMVLLVFGWYFFVVVSQSDAGFHMSVSLILALVAIAVSLGGHVFLISAASHKGLVRADVNALLKAAKLEDNEASEAMADIYIDRINDLDRMVERQEHHYRTGIWLEFAFAGLALLAFLIQSLVG